MPNKTFAFSNKFNKWATRYSFTPSWYGSVDKHLLSSQAGSGSVWRHDVNDTRCSFYGTDYKSKLVVASNQDPSAVKVFSALSLETNSNKWSADIKTNEERDVQGGSISNLGWKEKEGFLYANMPKSTTYSSSSISYVGRIADDYVAPSADNEYGLVDILYSDLIGTTDGFTMEIEIDRRSEVPLATGQGCQLIADVMYDDGSSAMSHVTGTFRSLTDLSGQGQGALPSGSLNELELVGVYGNVLRIRYRNVTGILWEDVTGPGNPATQPNALKWAIHVTALLCREPTYVISPANINGDSLRGPYAKVELSFDEGVPMQVSAVNVDYQFSKLDARLTQNT